MFSATAYLKQTDDLRSVRKLDSSDRPYAVIDVGDLTFQTPHGVSESLDYLSRLQRAISHVQAAIAAGDAEPNPFF